MSPADRRTVLIGLIVGCALIVWWWGWSTLGVVVLIAVGAFVGSAVVVALVLLVNVIDAIIDAEKRAKR